MNQVLVGMEAPDFTAPAVMGDNTINESFNLKEYLNGDYGIVFFYPLDFTFVCPSEILAFDHRVDAFAERGAKVIAVSIDSHFTHLAWKNTSTDEGGLGQVKFPMVADIAKDIVSAYCVKTGPGIAFRGTFIIDKNGVVRHQLINDLPLGRNVDETIRTLDALIFHEENGEVCPAGWTKGDEGMTATPEGVAAYLSANADKL